MKTLITLASLALAALATTAQAAEIKAYPNKCNNEQAGCTTITIEGTIAPNDGGRFMALLLQHNTKKALIMLVSDGGNLEAALQMGRYIHANGYSTLVPYQSYCISACAIVWAAGKFKQGDSTAKIGFHAAYTVQAAGRRAYAVESGQGNAVVGPYYAMLGYNEEAIRFFTKASPNTATWLSSTIAEKLGIQVSILVPTEAEKEMRKPPAKAAKQQTPSAQIP
jgi:hypothetical protein